MGVAEVVVNVRLGLCVTVLANACLRVSLRARARSAVMMVAVVYVGSVRAVRCVKAALVWRSVPRHAPAWSVEGMAVGAAVAPVRSDTGARRVSAPN